MVALGVLVTCWCSCTALDRRLTGLHKLGACGVLEGQSRSVVSSCGTRLTLAPQSERRACLGRCGVQVIDDRAGDRREIQPSTGALAGRSSVAPLGVSSVSSMAAEHGRARFEGRETASTAASVMSREADCLFYSFSP
jgi:hypothetical protein